MYLTQQWKAKSLACYSSPSPPPPLSFKPSPVCLSQVTEISMGEFLMHSSVVWLNPHPSLGRMRKDPEMTVFGESACCRHSCCILEKESLDFALPTPPSLTGFWQPMCRLLFLSNHFLMPSMDVCSYKFNQYKPSVLGHSIVSAVALRSQWISISAAVALIYALRLQAGI